PGGYSFKPPSPVVSKRAPPSPCKVCGSPKHWDRDCGYFPEYLNKKKNHVLFATDRSDREESIYNAVYTLYANEASFSAYASPPSALVFLSRLYEGVPKVLEVEDESVEKYRESPKWDGPGLLCEVGRELDAVSGIPSGLDDDPDSAPELLTVEDSDDDHTAPCEYEVPVVSLQPPELSKEELVIRMPRRRSPPDGMSTRGIRVLSCRGRVGAKDNPTTDIILDTGANLCTIDEDFRAAMPNPPRIKQGLKVQIAQLTSKALDIKGYVQFPVFIRGEDGATLEFEVEAYVVPNMSVPLLLGEDWQVNYELQILRNLAYGTRVGVGSSGHYFPASSNHRRARAARHRKKIRTSNGELRAFKDTIVPPNTTVFVDISSTLPLERDWLVERNLVCVGDDVFLTVANCLISTATDMLP
ncbi:hypothetical protein AURDEDRAFT_36096, partial [Auricularia subglabra TFB-10046 SS5]